MKKLLVVIAVAMLGNFSAKAQEKGNIELGAALGVNLTNVSTSDSDISGDTKTGFYGAVSGEYYFSDRWGIKAKLVSDPKGWANDYLFVNYSLIKTDAKLNYVTIPVMANWHFGRNRNWYLNFGLYAGFLLMAKETALDTDLKDELKGTDFGLAAGIGYKFFINDNTKIYIEYAEQAGFVDIVKENEGDALRNSRSAFNVGVLFTLD